MWKKNKYDIIVVGAGPVGSTFARLAAEGGLQVLVLERKTTIGVPVRCGEAVADSGLRKFHTPRQEWINATIDKFRFVAPNDESITVNLKDRGYVLDRTIFDSDLANFAEKSGATVVKNTNVTGLLFEADKLIGVKGLHDDNPFEITAKLIIAADGVESRIGRMAGLKTAMKLTEIDSCYQKTISGVEIDQATCDFYTSYSLAPHGYLWVFPKGYGRANVGIGISGIDAMQGESAKVRLNNFLKTKFPQHKIESEAVGGIPLSKPIKQMVTDNLMMIGDAARTVNPLSGGGIILGMKSAALAAEVALKIFKNNLKPNLENLIEYQNRWLKSEGKQINRIYRIKEAVTKISDPDLNRIIEKVQKLPKEKQTIARIFTAAIPQKPSLLLDIAKVFIGT